MFYPVSPESVLMIQKEKERELEQQIEQYRIEKERAALEKANNITQKQAWYAEASQWVNAKLFHRTPTSKRAVQSETLREPCTGVPC